jgi:hypothetical protein
MMGVTNKALAAILICCIDISLEGDGADCMKVRALDILEQ